MIWMGFHYYMHVRVHAESLIVWHEMFSTRLFYVVNTRSFNIKGPDGKISMHK